MKRRLPSNSSSENVKPKIPTTITTVTIGVHQRIQSTTSGRSNGESEEFNGITEEWTLKWPKKSKTGKMEVLGITQSSKSDIDKQLALTTTAIDYHFDDFTKEVTFSLDPNDKDLVKGMVNLLTDYIFNEELGQKDREYYN